MKNLRRIISRFEGRRLLVVGDVMLDQFIRGSVSRISPEAPVPVVSVSQEILVPGGAGNVAQNLAALKARVAILGVIGEDDAGRKLAADLGGRGVSIGRLIADPARVTSQKCRVIAEHQQVVRFDRETSAPLSAAMERRLLSELPGAVANSEAVILSDYGKGLVSPRILQAAIAQARSRRIPVVVDPKVENFPRYKRVTCITPNAHEAWAGMRLTPRRGLPALEDLGRRILSKLRCGSVLITRGADGMSLFASGKSPRHIPTQAQEVFDVTGAGDTVISVLTLALACGASLEDAAALSNAAAGIVVGKLGTAVTDCAELAEALR